MMYSNYLEKYFATLKKDCFKTYEYAKKAREKGYDPSDEVEITLAETMAERVIGLIGVVAPQIKNKGAEKRIEELEQEFGILDPRVALIIAEEVAKEKFCKFKDQKESIEMGIRTGFTYITLGVVSSPLEGFTHLEFKDRIDKKGKYLCIYYSGPIRNAGGTAAAWSVVIADYLRVKFGYGTYDPTEKEIGRCHAELEDYHEYVTNLQYFPSKEESEFMMKHLPIEISGEPSEKYEISNIHFKDLTRVNTDVMRSGYCLLHSSCLPLKAPKIWAKLSKWAEDFEMTHWDFLEEFISIQKKSKAAGKKNGVSKISPDYTYIKDLVAGRPVLGHPMAHGAFRLRYGRSRFSGYSGQSIHPATMQILNGYLATATQLKVERPGKAAAFTVCDSIDGPIVKLKNEEVIFLETESLAKKYKNEIKEILYLGDVLVCYGDFFDRAHPLVPAGYCHERWVLELEKVIISFFGTLAFEKVSEITNISVEKLSSLFFNPFKTKVSFDAAASFSKAFNIPLHPTHIFFWNALNLIQLKDFFIWLKTLDFKDNNIILRNSDSKRSLELLGIPHKLINKEFVVIEKPHSVSLISQTRCLDKVLLDQAIKLIDSSEANNNPLFIINNLSEFKILDRGGTFIGSRMGRPEKAKMRKMNGSPHVLFPVGSEGGKFRSFQAALEAGKVTAEFATYYCDHCKTDSLLPVCIECDKKARKVSRKILVGDSEREIFFEQREVNIKNVFDKLLKKIDSQIFPDLIKGVKGTFNAKHIPEHLIKGFIRAKHSVYVNKDGTTRYDSSEVPVTHFKPKEIFVSVEKLKSIGYTKDIHDNPLIDENQTLELKPQDIILPACPISPNEPADEVLFRISKFVDELLKTLYGLKPFYNLKSKEDLVGHYIIGLAPHTSAGILGRIIGFSKTQGFFAHPLFHAAMRRDVDGDESCILLLLDAFLNFSPQYLPSSRGSTMDAPLVLTYFLNPSEVDDMVFNVDIAWKYPLEFYEAADNYKMPWEVNVAQVGDFLGTPAQFEGYGFTHPTSDVNAGILCSAYKLLPSMEEKLKGQMDLAEKIRAVNESDVARLVIEKHFLRDTKGNLRKFSSQQFRCVACNAKFRRPPLIGKCTSCGGKIIFTISEGSVIKYLEPSLSLAHKYNVSPYLIQTLELTKRRIEDMFGKDKDRQEALGKWFG